MADSHANDPTAIIIGSSQNRTPRQPKRSKSATAAPLRQSLPEPDGQADVYIGGKYVGTISLKVAIRFSKTFATAFPKASDPPFTSGLPRAVNIEKSTAGIGNLSIAANNGPAQRAKHQLNLKMDTLVIQPNAASFTEAFSWMNVVQDTPRGEELSNFSTIKPEASDLHKLVNWYAASLVLELRPPARQLTRDIIAKISVSPLSPEDIAYLYDHLPLRDIIMTRAITSFYDFKAQGAYGVDDLGALTAYFQERDSGLHNRYRSIGKAHWSSKSHAASNSSAGSSRVTPSTAPSTVETGGDVEEWSAEAVSHGGGSVEKSEKPGNDAVPESNVSEAAGNVQGASESVGKATQKRRKQRGKKSVKGLGLGRDGKPVPGVG